MSETANDTVWYTIVGFGPSIFRPCVTRDRDKCEAARRRYSIADMSGYTEAHTYIYGYRTRALARKAHICDEIGQDGRIA